MATIGAPAIPVNTIVGVSATKNCFGGALTTALAIQPVVSGATSLATLPVASPVLATSAGASSAAVPMFLSVPNAQVPYLRNNDIVAIVSLSYPVAINQPFALASIGTSVVWLGLSAVTDLEKPTFLWRVWIPTLPAGAPVPTGTNVTLIHVGYGLALTATSSGSFILADPKQVMCPTYIQFSSAASAIAADSTWVLPLWLNEYFATWQQPVQWIPDWLPAPWRPRPVPGSDRDSHGCIPSAGYSWCPTLGRCVRPWETPCPSTPSSPCPPGREWCPLRQQCIYAGTQCGPWPGPTPPGPSPPGPSPPGPYPSRCPPGQEFCAPRNQCIIAGTQCTLPTPAPNPTVCEPGKEYCRYKGCIPAGTECTPWTPRPPAPNPAACPPGREWCPLRRECIFAGTQCTPMLGGDGSVPGFLRPSGGSVPGFLRPSHEMGFGMPDASPHATPGTLGSFGLGTLGTAASGGMGSRPGRFDTRTHGFGMF